jgi:type I restriction enzyme, S subunit
VRVPCDDLVVSTGFAVLTPNEDLDSRFVGWWAQSSPFVEEIVARSAGVSYPAINASEIGDVLMPFPPLAAQCRIADYLDTETARIDALIEKKRRMMKLLEERLESVTTGLLWGWGADRIAAGRLRQVALRIDVGIAEAATHAYADEGVPLLRSMNIRPNRIDDEDLLFIEPWFAEKHRSKTIHTDDILTVRTGNAGVSALVPARLDGCQCFTQLITTIRPPNVAAFYSAALNSGPARRYFEAVGWGSAQANISVPLLASAPVPMVFAEVQAKVVLAVADVRMPIEEAMVKLRDQLALLTEHRNGLITSAVTGTLPIPGLSG